MNKFDTAPQTTSFAVATTSQSDASTLRHSLRSQGNASLSTGPVPAGRLIVLVPFDSDYAAATRRIWELAVATCTRVLFLGLCQDMAEEPSLRRQLVTISALVGDGRVVAEAKVEIGTNWVNAVKRNYQAGDMIVCFAEQRAGILHRPLSQILESKLNMPVYILSGLYTQDSPQSNPFAQISAWMGSIGIIIGSSLLQIRIAATPQDWAQTTLLILSVVFEAWLIWVWNSIF